MYYKHPVIVFNFDDVSLEFESVKETSRKLNISEGKIRRCIDKGIPVKSQIGKVFLDYKIKDYEDE
jgi:hypothetical protein